MRTVLEITIFLALTIIYGLNHNRHQYIKKRTDTDVRHNIKKVAQNLVRMIYFDKKFRLIGDLGTIKNGAVLYSIHFGVWELMPQIVNRYINNDIGILVNRYTDNNPFLIGKLMDRFFHYWRSNHNAKVFYPDEVFRIVKFIKNGGIFAVLVDGNGFFSKYKKIEKLARLCQVPLIPFAVYCEAKTTIMKMGCNLEELVRNRPHDYWWFYKSRRTSGNQ
ncbi:MAG: hypothetical protein ACUVQ3_06210 [bacterium]